MKAIRHAACNRGREGGRAGRGGRGAALLSPLLATVPRRKHSERTAVRSAEWRHFAFLENSDKRHNRLPVRAPAHSRPSTARGDASAVPDGRAPSSSSSSSSISGHRRLAAYGREAGLEYWLRTSCYGCDLIDCAPPPSPAHHNPRVTPFPPPSAPPSPGPRRGRSRGEATGPDIIDVLPDLS